MKPIKKIAYGGMILGMSLMLLGGCGSKDKPKETTASSAQTESSQKKESEAVDPDSGKNHHITLDNPFQKNIPQYVCDGNDSNRRVQAVIIPYSDSKDEVKVTEYDNGKAEKSYIVPYKIKKITSGDKNHLPIYQYSFYDKGKDNWRNFDVTLTKFDDIKGQVFLSMVELDTTDKPSTAKNYSDKELREKINAGNGWILYDDQTVISMK